MKKIITVVLMLIASQFNLKAQQRIIHWVHGFGANPSAWFPVVSATEIGATGYPARNVIGHNATYTKLENQQAINNLSDAGSALRMAVRDFLAPYGGIGSDRAKNSFVIAHSQGGLVSRWSGDISIPATVGNQAHFGGLVTFGTPHAGAKIATSRYDGTLDVFLNGACNDFAGGFLDSEIAQLANTITSKNYGRILNFFGIPDALQKTVSNVRNDICNLFFSKTTTSTPRTTEFLSQRVLGTLLGSGGTRSVIEDPILADYQLGAQRLNQLNAAPLQPIVRVNFYGKEPPEQSFLKSMHYILAPSQTLPAFEATDDKENGTLLLFGGLRASAENDAIAFEQHANSMSCNFLDFWCYARIDDWRNNLYDGARALKRAVTWMDNSNAQWLSLIGALTQTVTSTRICKCDAGAIPGTDPNRCASVNVRGGCRWVPEPVTTTTDEASDGIVTRSSAIAMPGAITLSPEQMEMAGSQHMQMRNDPNTRDKLNALFGGGIHFFFITP